MLDAKLKRHDLAKFLRALRERASPEQVGLRSTTRRRVSGLRRDEVAELADISVTWYTWLEQARQIKVSAQALDRIATALQCVDEERAYLFQLAGENPPAKPFRATAPPDNFQQLLDSLDPNPAYAVCPRFDIVAWNASAASVFGDFARYPEEARNLLWILFTDSSMKDLFVEWERFARCIIAWFRGAYAKTSDDCKWAALLAALERVSPQFRTWWGLHEVATPPDWPKELRHAAGRMVLDPITLNVHGDAGLAVVAYTPARGTETAALLAKLAEARRAVSARRGILVAA